MEQHPIPQNISSYQFRLVGDMTLKQFFELAGGVVVGLIFYSSPLLGIIKWPFAIISVILGIALAFLPLEERPLERWIVAFFRAIYSPTLYYWKRGDVGEKIFQDEVPQATGAPVTEEVVEKYLGVKTSESAFSKLEEAEKGFLQSLSNLFSGIVQAVTPGQQASGATPNQVQAAPPQPLQVPFSPPVRIAPEINPKVVVEETRSNITASPVAPLLAGEEMVSTHQAMFSLDAAPPNPPITPNIVVGQVVDENRKIIENAIMEIRDSLGRPVRALKSNKVGHFIIVTPLDSGKYTLVAEKEGFEFMPVDFQAEGELIPPILVRGRRIDNLNVATA